MTKHRTAASHGHVANVHRPRASIGVRFRQIAAVGLLMAGAASSGQELVRSDIKVGVVPPTPGHRDFRLGVSGAF